MSLRIFAAAVLLVICNWASADYLLVKIDLDQIDVRKLSGDDNRGKVPVKNPSKKGDDLPRESNNWIYAIFEYDGKTKEKIDYSAEDPKQFLLNFNPKNFPPQTKDKTKIQPRKEAQPDAEKKAILLKQRAGYKAIPLRDEFVCQVLRQQSLAEIYAGKKQGLKNEVNPVSWRSLAEWALKHGMIREYHDAMARLTEVAPKHKAAENYARLREEMKKPITLPPPLSEAVEKVLQKYGKRTSANGRYTVYFNDKVDAADVDRRLKQMEEAFTNFFSFFALQENGAVLTVPPYSLPVLLESPKDFAARSKSWSPAQESTSGFTFRRDNLVVLCTRPTIGSYNDLERNMQTNLQAHGLNMKEMLSGEIFDGKNPKGIEIVTYTLPNKQVIERPALRFNVAALQTVALLQKAMEDDEELSSTSRECTRQLLDASGLLSRNVAAPAWIENGLVRFFEIPPVHLHRGFGQPRGDLVHILKNLPGSRKDFNSSDVLLKLATDEYLRKKDKGEAKKSRAIGNAAAWGLVFYLQKEGKLDSLLKYAGMVNEMPRHMQLHPRTLESFFDAAFLGENSFAERSKGRGHFLISELGEPRRGKWMDFARQQKIANDQVTLDQYLLYLDQARSAYARKWFEDMDTASPEYPDLETFCNR